jgi:3-phenylpropionate/cinnamic acid dioxygenase small subunit
MIADAALRASTGEADRQDLALLLEAEVEYLDRRRYRDWLDLYTQDCLYWMPLNEEQTDPLDHVSLFYEDRTAMELRIKRITHPRAHSLVPPVRISHLCGAVSLDRVDADSGEWVLTRRFQVTESQGDRTRSFAGFFTYHVPRVEDQMRIRVKRVDLVNCEAALEAIQVYI